MGIFDKFVARRQQSTVMTQLPQVQNAVADCIDEFKKRTKLSYAHVLPITLDIAVQLYVKEFGLQSAREHFEGLFKRFADEAGLREDQFKSFGTPEIRLEELPHTTELNAALWRLSNDLVARGIRMETVASALVNICVGTALQAGGPLYGVGLLLNSARRLRAGKYG